MSTKLFMPRQFYTAKPWRCSHLADASLIEIFLPDRGDWVECMSVWERSKGLAEDLANFTVGTINREAELNRLISEARAVLSGVMVEGLDFSTEQEIERMLADIAKLAA